MNFSNKKNPIGPFFDASGATICIGREVRCLPYAGFLMLIPNDVIYILVMQEVVHNIYLMLTYKGVALASFYL